MWIKSVFQKDEARPKQAHGFSVSARRCGSHHPNQGEKGRKGVSPRSVCAQTGGSEGLPT